MYLTVSVNPSTADRYFTPTGFSANLRSTESSISNISAYAPGFAGTITELHATADVNTSDATQVYHLYINNVDSGLSVGLPNGGKHASVTGLSTAFTATDAIGWYNPAGASSTAAPVDLTIRITES